MNSDDASKSLSSGIVIGLTIVAVLAVALAVFVALLFAQRRRRRAEIERNLIFVKTSTSTLNSSADLQKFNLIYNSSSKLVSPYASASTSMGTMPVFVSSPAAVSNDLSTPNTSSTARKSFHPNRLPPSPRKSQLQSIIPPSLSAPSKVVPSIRRLSSQEIIGHHTANGTMPRRFAPLLVVADSSEGVATGIIPTPSNPDKHHKATARISRSSIISNRPRSSLYLSTSASGGELNVNPSLSSVSIMSQTSSSARLLRQPQPEVLKVRSIFTPLLPDELVLRPNENLTIIKNCSDGWCIVGRKSPFYVPSSPVRKEFGQRNNHPENAAEIEIGAVPTWVFESGRNVPGERPPRIESLRVVVTMGDDDEDQKDRKDVVSWSNVY